jgi:RND family efflux transporter MFP subunit
MTLVAVPIQFKAKRWFPWAIATGVAFVAVAGYAGFTKWKASRSSAAPIVAAGKFYAVAPIDFDVKVNKDGELAAVNNIDILNLVEGQSTIVQIVKEGTFVKKGETLVELDSSEIRQKIEDSTLDQQKSDADLVTARELRSIQESENAANLEAAEVEVELAKLALKQYVEGTYVQELADAETAVKMAETTLKNKEEDLTQTRALYGKGFVTGADVKQDELEVIEAQNTLASNKMKLKVLKEYTYPSELAEKKSKLVQSEQLLERVKKKNASQLAKVIADEKAAEQTLVTKKRKVEHYQSQLAVCLIKAPTAGLVVYAGDRNYSQSQIIEGAQVRERQQLLRLPDTSSMKAVLRINESQVPKLRVGQKAMVKIVGVNDPVPATLTKISPLADSGSRWWNPDLKEYPVELTLDKTPKDVKPGIGVQAEIYTDRLSDVLAVPLAAIYADRTNNYVFVRSFDGEDVKPVAVKIGETNETHARIASGLKPGENVLILQAGQGRELLERGGISTSDGPDRKDRKSKDKSPAQPTAVAASPATPSATVSAPVSPLAPDASAKPAKRRERTPLGVEPVNERLAPASKSKPAEKSAVSRIEPTA